MATEKSQNVQDVFLDFTFLTLAMLVVGGAGSLWGAVVGALALADRATKRAGDLSQSKSARH